LQLKRPDVNALSSAADELSKSGADADTTAAAADKLKTFCDKWTELETAVAARVKLAQAYVAFHKRAQQVRVSPINQSINQSINQNYLFSEQCRNTRSI